MSTMQSRRFYLKSIFTGLGASSCLAGCSSLRENNRTSTSTEKRQTQPTSLDILHSWSTSLEKDAAHALFDGFQQRHPDLKVDDLTIGGRVGGDLQTTVKKRIIEEKSPSSWQTWGGENLQTYGDAGALTEIRDDFWSGKTGWESFSPIVRRLSKVNRSYVAIPFNIHRLNDLFYNINILEDVGIDPESIDDPQSLLDAVKIVKEDSEADGVVHATNTFWSTLELWESMLLGEFGFQTHRSIVDGNVRSNEDAIRSSLESVKQYCNQSPETVISPSRDQTVKRFQNGNSAFFYQGDWVAKELMTDDEFRYGTDWGHMAFPGTEDDFLLSLTLFPFPENSPSHESTAKFLRYIGSRNTQKRFTLSRGAIPARNDVSQEAFGPFFRQQIARFRGPETNVPSMSHGLVIAPEAWTKLTGAMKSFTSTWDVDRTTQHLMGMFE
ncbi:MULTISPECIES: ABC transporter substrate-binding protein [unclassified Haladaptatus]|uniref:ABC transporter substrate-binding protein n=1 Tax=unclassified Haladaptatus TaxID=2622732 RepID=UPI00209C1ABA|nr:MULTISPECIES: ABC transporter substrate-binding protein [unclassified Haladaptatus]MCO8244949.1 ABC transporter substrate-binding protein [Haladaptatus sp. AB643]MCO8255538.1 ABC transporter substrate-binding protein [Haladaptatus sp. AB618]